MSELSQPTGREQALRARPLADGVTLSPHLRPRVEVGDIFLQSGVPTVVLQAGVVSGSGSASFEMIRHLTEVLP